jgi:hypothetical protein
MTRYDLIVNTIAEVLPEATDITELQTGVKQRLGHPVSTGLLETMVTAAALETDVIPPLCTRLPHG